MISKEKLAEMDLPTIEKEISSRHELINQMIGNLYPNILENEIIQLCQRRGEIEYPILGWEDDGGRLIQ